MTYKSIAVAIPCLNAGDEIENTIRSILKNSSGQNVIEFGLVDDGSKDKPLKIAFIEYLKNKYKCEIYVRFNKSRRGVAVTRNLAVNITNAPIVFITDAHIEVSVNWDLKIINSIDEKTVLALTICDTSSKFRGYGCELVVPFMGTHWVRKPPTHFSKCEIASSAGTVLYRSIFDHIGGYDEGMNIYGAIEPEFSLRIWLSGVQIRVLTETYIFHVFKNKQRVDDFLSKNRTNMIHNSLRFGVLYLDDNKVLEMLRYYSVDFKDHFSEALSILNQSDVWNRKEELKKTLIRSFPWYCQHLRVKDQSGTPLWANQI